MKNLRTRDIVLPSGKAVAVTSESVEEQLFDKDGNYVNAEARYFDESFSYAVPDALFEEGDNDEVAEFIRTEIDPECDE